MHFSLAKLKLNQPNWRYLRERQLTISRIDALLESPTIWRHFLFAHAGFRGEGKPFEAKKKTYNKLNPRTRTPGTLVWEASVLTTPIIVCDSFDTRNRCVLSLPHSREQKPVIQILLEKVLTVSGVFISLKYIDRTTRKSMSEVDCDLASATSCVLKNPSQKNAASLLTFHFLHGYISA